MFEVTLKSNTSGKSVVILTKAPDYYAKLVFHTVIAVSYKGE